MKLGIFSHLVLPVSALLLTQCTIQLDENGNIPGTYGQPSSTSYSSSTVPSRITNDCLAAVRSKVGYKTARVVRAERGENSFIVDVQVEGVPNLWRCYHDGNRVTNTVYQGEG